MLCLTDPSKVVPFVFLSIVRYLAEITTNPEPPKACIQASSVNVVADGLRRKYREGNSVTSSILYITTDQRQSVCGSVRLSIMSEEFSFGVSFDFNESTCPNRIHKHRCYGMFLFKAISFYILLVYTFICL